jgi:hypothetical protein
MGLCWLKRRPGCTLPRAPRDRGPEIKPTGETPTAPGISSRSGSRTALGPGSTGIPAAEGDCPLPGWIPANEFLKPRSSAPLAGGPWETRLQMAEIAPYVVEGAHGHLSSPSRKEGRLRGEPAESDEIYQFITALGCAEDV